MTDRRGISLVELIVLMTAISTILSFTVVVLHRTMRAHNRARATHADELSAWRLSGALRRDLAEAVGATVDRASETARLTIRSLADGSISYRFDPLVVVRSQETHGGGLRSEEFAFAGPVDWEIAVRDSPGRLEVRTATDPAERTLAVAPVQMRLVSRLGGGAIPAGGSP